MKLQKLYFFYLLSLILVAGSGCKVMNQSIMLRTGTGYQYAVPEDTVSLEYLISPNDLLDFRLFSNNGFKLIDLSMNSNGQNIISQSRSMQYLVEFDGQINLPLLGRIDISGKTLRQAEQMLEDKYAAIYNDPFVMLKVVNRRVIIFPGTGSTAKVIQLQNENTTLIEALAQAGGITNSGKAHKIKLIRGDPANPEVYLIDLSTIDGLKDANMILQANDIIYVDPIFHVTKELLAEITPIVSLITSTLIILGFINAFAK